MATTLKRFRIGQRVRIVDQALDPQFSGRTGRVDELRIADGSALVLMDEELPDHLRHFPRDHKFARDLLLYPDECVDAEE